MLPDSTTTIGDGESARTDRPFHIYPDISLAVSLSSGWFAAAIGYCVERTMNADDRIRAKLSTCVAAWRGLPRLDNILNRL